jgi:biopolymer transport protein TolR
VINKDKSVMINQEPATAPGFAPCNGCSQLGPRLEDIFKTRAERVVFVKGDPDLEFQYVAKAIDIAHGAGIDKVGLMTPQMEAGQ